MRSIYSIQNSYLALNYPWLYKGMVQLYPPPLEDLSPLLPREELEENMLLIGLHPKSKAIEVKVELKKPQFVIK